jgi:cysteinyl-tRNA synthetase
MWQTGILGLSLQIINRANELGEDPVRLSRRFCDEFQVDMELLRCLPPSVEPRVTDHIPQIIEMISKVSIVYVSFNSG